MGKYDFVEQALLANLRCGILFHRSEASSPGRPMVFGQLPEQKRYFFGLPGNPVSSIVTFRSSPNRSGRAHRSKPRPAPTSPWRASRRMSHEARSNPLPARPSRIERRGRNHPAHPMAGFGRSVRGSKNKLLFSRARKHSRTLRRGPRDFPAFVVTLHPDRRTLYPVLMKLSHYDNEGRARMVQCGRQAGNPPHRPGQRLRCHVF